MSEYLFLKLNKEVSVNPEYAPVNPDSLVQTDKKTNIAMVSEEAIDTEMTDKVEFSSLVSKPETPKAPVLQQQQVEEEKSWFEKAWDKTCDVASKVVNVVKTTTQTVVKTAGKVIEKAAESVEQGAKWCAIKANKLIDSETIHDAIRTWDLDDDNNEAAADMSASSKLGKIRQRAAEFVSNIKDVTRQAEVALKQIQECDEEVRLGYAKNYHSFHPENQSNVSYKIVACSCSAGTVKEVIKNAPLCAPEQQSTVAGAIADGLNRNKNFNDDTKTELGIDLANGIQNFEESQQADAYNQVANKLNQYQRVVDAVKYQVANVASARVREEAMAKLQTSQYENVKMAFTAEAIQKAQEAFKAANGGKITSKQAEIIREAVKADLAIAVDEGKQEGQIAAQKQIAIEVKAKKEAATVSNPFKKETVVELNNNKIKFSHCNSRVEYLALKHDLENCKTVDEFAKCVKDLAKKDLKNIMKSIPQHAKEEMFTTTTSVYLQAFLLRSGVVDYEDVKNDCLPGINNQIEVFTLNHDIEYAIQRLNG